MEEQPTWGITRQGNIAPHKIDLRPIFGFCEEKDIKIKKKTHSVKQRPPAEIVALIGPLLLVILVDLLIMVDVKPLPMIDIDPLPMVDPP